MNALFWKDARVNWLVLSLGIVLLAGPYVAITVAYMMTSWGERLPLSNESAWSVLLISGCQFSAMFSQITLALLAGNIIAVERSDRSAEFLAYLPPSKRQVMLSKLMLLAAVSATIWGVNLLVKVVAYHLAADPTVADYVSIIEIPFVACVGICAVGVGWLCSAMFPSAGPAAAMALIAPWLLAMMWLSVSYLSGWPDQESFDTFYQWSCLVLGVGCFVGGCVYFLRRVEP